MCYSWWILSSLSILGKVNGVVDHNLEYDCIHRPPLFMLQVSWIDEALLTTFILQCQETDHGGISDRPGNLPDVFHTFFGVCGLLLLDAFGKRPELISPEIVLQEVDPTYALPRSVVARLGLRSQTYRALDKADVKEP